MKPIMYLFSASWCQPCKMIKPAFETIAYDNKDHCDTRVIDVETAEAADLLQKYEIAVVPTIIMDAGINIERIEGALPPNQLVERIDNWIESL